MEEERREERWRLILGGGAADGIGKSLKGPMSEADHLLEQLYDGRSKRGAGLGSSAPKVSRWLGDIRKYFPSSVVRIMQKDAIERLGLDQLLLEPEVLETLEPDVELVSTLLSLKNAIPAKTKASARMVVNTVVEKLKRRLNLPTLDAVKGSLQRLASQRKPDSFRFIDWKKTIHKNLANYRPEISSIIPERFFSYSRKHKSMKDVILCVDQSGSMASSLVYSSVFAASLASLPSITTRMLVFDTEVADLSDFLHDPVDLLFGTNLGGGTDIAKVLSYSQHLIHRPKDTLLLLISDLFDGGDERQVLEKLVKLKKSGVTVVCLLALNDQGKPYYNQQLAESLSAYAIPSFACTPDLFPQLLSKSLEGKEIDL